MTGLPKKKSVIGSMIGALGSLPSMVRKPMSAIVKMIVQTSETIGVTMNVHIRSVPQRKHNCSGILSQKYSKGLVPYSILFAVSKKKFLRELFKS